MWPVLATTVRRRPVLTVIASVCGAGAAVEAHTAATPNHHTLPLHYDQEAIRLHFRRRPLQVAARVIGVAAEVAPLLCSLAWHLVGSRDRPWANRDAPQAHSDRREWQRDFAVRLKESLVRLGPCMVKLGQALSIRPDVLPPELIQQLQQLCDDVPPFSTPDAIAVLERELGGGAVARFVGLTPSTAPVAAASLGQVYRVRLAGTGEEVAVKVQRPDMVGAVALDLYLLRKWTGVVESVKSLGGVHMGYDLALVDTFGTATFHELDYVHEAANQLEFKRAFADSTEVYVPSVVESLTTRRVLVTEWIDGMRLVDSPQATIQRLTPIGIACFLTQLLDHGFFHSDPHPGNLLVDKSGRLVLIDFGLCARIALPATGHITAALVHLMRGNVPELLEDAVQLGFLHADVDRTALLPVLAKVFARAKLEAEAQAAENTQLTFKTHERRMQFTAVSGELNQIFFDFPFEVPDYFALVTRALIVLEGIALVGDPQFDMFAAAYPFALRKALAEMTPEEQIRSARAVGSATVGVGTWSSIWTRALVSIRWACGWRL